MDSKTQEFLQKLKDSGHWNDDYDYSELIYSKGDVKAIVINKKLNTRHFIPLRTILKGSKCVIKNAPR
ncbi:hypothetical protein N9S80_01885 [Flavobacteriaceae bacterium]|nr:hypothetical protein [Flavobacteriaceae bacterium]